MSKDYVWQGIEDGGHNVLRCDSCERDIADIWVTKPSDEVSFNYVALCPYCNEQSKVVKVTGFVHVGGTEKTRLKDLKTSDGTCVIHLDKEQ